MATWAAQLQSIQQLGARLSRLDERPARSASRSRPSSASSSTTTTSASTGSYGEDLIPVAMQGQVGEYVDETPEQLRVTLGEGITGWVAEHGVAQNLADAANDPRADTIPGTEDDLDESMLLAPDDLRGPGDGRPRPVQAGPATSSRDDDLRLLVIYASFAAQAMANADATERLREQSRRAGAPGPRPARAAPDHRVDPDDARPAGRPRADRRAARRRSSAPTTSRSRSSTRRAGLLMPLTARGVDADELPASRGSPARRASRRGSSSTTSRPTSTTSATTRASTSSATTGRRRTAA